MVLFISRISYPCTEKKDTFGSRCVLKTEFWCAIYKTAHSLSEEESQGHRGSHQRPPSPISISIPKLKSDGYQLSWIAFVRIGDPYISPPLLCISNSSYSRRTNGPETWPHSLFFYRFRLWLMCNYGLFPRLTIRRYLVETITSFPGRCFYPLGLSLSD